jgi:hypothetical protein
MRRTRRPRRTETTARRELGSKRCLLAWDTRDQVIMEPIIAVRLGFQPKCRA